LEHIRSMRYIRISLLFLFLVTFNLLLRPYLLFGVYGPYADVYTAVPSTGPCTRSYTRTRPEHGPYTGRTACSGRVRGVYVYTTVYTTVFTAPVHVPYTHTAVYTVRRRPCTRLCTRVVFTCTWAMYTGVYTGRVHARSCTRPVHDRANMARTRLCTRSVSTVRVRIWHVYTVCRARPCLRPVHIRVHERA